MHLPSPGFVQWSMHTGGGHFYYYRLQFGIKGSKALILVTCFLLLDVTQLLSGSSFSLYLRVSHWRHSIQYPLKIMVRNELQYKPPELAGCLSPPGIHYPVFLSPLAFTLANQQCDAFWNTPVSIITRCPSPANSNSAGVLLNDWKTTQKQCSVLPAEKTRASAAYKQ